MQTNECMLRGTFNITCLNSSEPSVEFRVKNKSFYNLASSKDLHVTLDVDLEHRMVTVEKSEDGLLVYPRKYEKSRYTVTTKSTELKEFLKKRGVYDAMVGVARRKSKGHSTTICVDCHVKGLQVHYHDPDSELVASNLPSARVNLNQGTGVDVYWKDIGIEISRVITDNHRNRLGSRARLLHMTTKLSHEIERGIINRGIVIIPSSARKLVERARELLYYPMTSVIPCP